MKVHFLTIVLDGMPWITHHLPVFNRLPFDWEWSVVEGVALPMNCTAWCKRIHPRLSVDGTHEYLQSIKAHPKVKLFERPSWNGKIEMVNAPLPRIKEPCLLWEVDADELWTDQQIAIVQKMFGDHPERNCSEFHCRYFVGPNIVVKRIPGTWTNNVWDWRRVWRYEPGMRFRRHEPPEIGGHRVPFTKDEMAQAGVVMDHYAYATEEQVRFKETYYGYLGAVDQWRRLQENKQWPAKLKDFFSWVDDGAMAELL